MHLYANICVSICPEITYILYMVSAKVVAWQLIVMENMACCFSGISQKWNYWISVNDIDVEGTFVDSPYGEPVMWSNWGVTGRGKSEPNGGRNENCVAVYRADLSWHDYPCDREHLPLCYDSVEHI